MKNKIFITGASGFLGQELVSRMSKSYEVIALVNRKKVKNKSVVLVKGNLRDISSWEKNLVGVDMVVHLAGVTHSKDAHEYTDINSEATKQLVSSAKKYGVGRFIYISTRAIRKKSGAYGDSKRKAEVYIKRSGISYTILRVAEAYDEDFRMREGLGSLFNMVKRSPIVLYPAGNKISLSPVHVADVQDSILAVIKFPSSKFKTYTIAGPESLSFEKIVMRMSRFAKTRKVLIPVPIPIFMFLYLVHSMLGLGSASDQLSRLLSKKSGLSVNVKKDLGINPRKFLL